MRRSSGEVSRPSADEGDTDAHGGIMDSGRFGSRSTGVIEQ
jgi:hypothetical protein